MSASIDLPCGCKLTAAFVIAMCFQHAMELKQQERIENAAHDEFERKFRSANEASE